MGNYIIFIMFVKFATALFVFAVAANA